jgi:hypothetical protein
MTEVPKIVYDRLRAARPERALPGRALPERLGPERAHPDADLLTAFAEQALSATERDGVLEHLALCLDCRDVIALALPAADIVAAPIAAEGEAVRAAVLTKAERNWLTSRKFAWPTLRWAALAAGIAVVASVLLLRPGKLNQAMPPSVNPQVATTMPPASGQQIASSPVPSLPVASSSTASPSTARTDEARPKSESRLSKKFKAGQVVTPSLQAEPGILVADSKKDSGRADKLSVAPTAGAPAFDYHASASRGATETVQVSAAASAAALAPSPEGSLMARNEAPAIEKAKPALQGIETNEQQETKAAVGPGPAKLQARNVMSAAKLASPASPTLAHNVTWAITGGALQRSLDSGQSWQNALRADHPLLCYASHDEDVWTGGQAGALFHSANSGVTWVQVQPSIKGQTLSSDVTHIDLHGDVRGPAEIVVSTSNNEIWSSADGGKTWDKK